MKDNAQETIGNYDGNARPGEIVADLTQDPPTLYIGNNLGQLTLLNSGGGSYGNTQVGQYLAAGLVGNIIPSGNGVYSLGNSTNWWSNVWLTGNTLYIGGIPVGMSGNSLTVNGRSVTTGDLNILGTNIGIANGVAETTMAFGGAAANVIVDTDSGAPKINIYAQSTDFQSYSQGDSDYTSAEWVTDGGGGAINITGAQSYVEAFVATLNQYSLVTITINGTDTVPYNGASYGGGSITIYTNTAPATSPTAVTDIRFNLTFENGLYMDPDEGDMLLKVGDFNLNIRSQRDININASDDLRLTGNDLTRLAGNANVTIVSALNTDPNYGWTFDTTGNITLPSNGIISNPPNSSLDPVNPNVATMVLTPDANYSYQALVLDPTAPGHIHLRGPSYSGNIDQPAANIFLGGELSSFEVGASYGDAPNVFVRSNGITWTFDNVGTLTVPGNITSAVASPAPSINGFSSIGSIVQVTSPQPFADLTAVAGARAFVSDANLVAGGNFGNQISGGGSNTVPVWSDGTNWYIG